MIYNWFIQHSRSIQHLLWQFDDTLILRIVTIISNLYRIKLVENQTLTQIYG